MEYLDFEVRIGLATEGVYPVSIIRSPAGEQSIQMRISREDLLSAMGALPTPEIESEAPSRDFVFGGQSLRPQATTVKSVGQSLFESLLPVKLRNAYRNSLFIARDRGKGLRLRIRVEAPELASLPWEYLYDEEERDFLSLSIETPLTRYLELGRPAQQLKVQPPIHVLGMIAAPKDQTQLDVEREKEMMEEAVRRLIDDGYLTLSWLENAGWRDLQDALRKGAWHVFHFIGHGGFDEASEEGYLALENEDETTYRLSGADLARLIQGHKAMRLVVLNACEGARASRENIFSSTVALLINQGIPAVVSMQHEISDRAALEFSRTFYDIIADNLPVELAVSEARKSIHMAMRDSVEWGTPVLHLRAEDGRLFNIDVASAIFKVEAAARPPQSEPPPPAESTAKPPLKSVDADLQKGLRILLEKVKVFWVKGVLNNSLQHSSLIELGIDAKPELVDSPWGSIALEGEKNMTGVFEDLGGSFLILGAPGSGKTTMLLTLAQDLVARREKDSSRRTPVVVNLSSWSRSGKALEEWLADELSAKYLVPKQISRNWLKGNHLLLLLDGLDEVFAERRAACVDAINTFTQRTSLTPVVVCCRLNDYLQLPNRLSLNGAVNLRSLTREQVLSHLDSGGERLEPLRALLRRDSSLQMLAHTPFMLSMMIRTFQDLPAEVFEGEHFTTIAARKSQLMEAYVQRRLRLAKIEGSNA